MNWKCIDDCGEHCVISDEKMQNTPPVPMKAEKVCKKNKCTIWQPVVSRGIGRTPRCCLDGKIRDNSPACLNCKTEWHEKCIKNKEKWEKFDSETARTLDAQFTNK